VRIHSLTYQNHAQKWGFGPIEFFDLTLLVGISGVGKTQILMAIDTLRNLAIGEGANGVEWELKFEQGGEIYTWRGKTETVTSKEPYRYSNSDQSKILFEGLFIEGGQIFERDETQILFRNKDIPKLSSYESLISILREEKLIYPITKGFKQISFRDHARTFDPSSFFLEEIANPKSGAISDSMSLNQIKELEYSVIIKLFIIQRNFKDFFNQIKNSYLTVFPNVEDIKIVLKKDSGLSMKAGYLYTVLKEKGVDRWIPQDEISSGMIRTLYHIAEMYLLPKGSVVLIDEFENSLGVNCINVLVEDLIYEHRNIQFIATSHHPYIINKIPYQHWKIVTRKGGQIIAHDAREFDMGESSHERFMSLINLPTYQQGIQLS